MMGYETTLSAKEWDKVEKTEAKQIEEMNTVKAELTSSTTSVIETIKEEDNLANSDSSDKKQKRQKKEKKRIGKVRKTFRIIFWTVLLLAIIYAAIGLLRAYEVFDFWAQYKAGDIYNTILDPGYEFGVFAKTTIGFLGNWEAFMNWYNSIF